MECLLSLDTDWGWGQPVVLLGVEALVRQEKESCSSDSLSQWFLDKEPKEGDHMPWLLAYTHALQHMGEAMEGRTWHPIGMHFTLQVSPLVDAFIKEMGAELTELRIASCWSQLAVEIPLQKQDGPFADVIAYLDDLARCMLTWKAWDELVFPAPLTEPSVPCKSNHLGYILVCTVDLGGALPLLRFHMTEPSGKLVGVAHGLLFEGNILAYDPASNGMEWVPVRGTVNNLSPMEDSSAQELSNITLPDSPKDIPQMDRFGEHCQGPAPVPPTVASHAGAAPHDEEEVMEQELPEQERECGEYTEEVDSPVSSPQNSTDSDRHTEKEDSLESSQWNSADSDRQTEEKDEGELSDKPTGEPADETAVKLTEGHSPDDELTEDHPPGDELTEGHPPDYEPAETITVECLTSGWELPPGGAWEEDRVVIHASENEMDHLC